MSARKREVYIFEENHEVQLRIHANLCQLYAMLDSHYSTAIKHEAETLIRHYEYMEEIIKAGL